MPLCKSFKDGVEGEGPSRSSLLLECKGMTRARFFLSVARRRTSCPYAETPAPDRPSVSLASSHSGRQRFICSGSGSARTVSAILVSLFRGRPRLGPARELGNAEPAGFLALCGARHVLNLTYILSPQGIVPGYPLTPGRPNTSTGSRSRHWSCWCRQPQPKSPHPATLERLTIKANMYLYWDRNAVLGVLQ